MRPLIENDLRELIGTRYRLGPADTSRLIAYLQERAEGNPFFLSELLSTLEEERILRAAADGWSLDDLSQVRVPSLLRQVIDSRSASLGKAAQELLAAAAVIGQEMPLALWSATCNVGEEVLLATVEKAVEAHLLTESLDGMQVRFVHALTRAAIYEGILPQRRRHLHRRVAETLMVAPRADPDTVAYHLQRAGDARAMNWLIKAGDRAETYVCMGDGARALRSDALYSWSTATQTPEQRAWLLLRIAALSRYDTPERAMEVLETARAYAATAQDPMLAAYMLLHSGQIHCLNEEVAQGLKELETGVAALCTLRVEQQVQINTLPRSITMTVDTDGQGALVFQYARSGRYAKACALGERIVAKELIKTEGDAFGLNCGDAYNGLGIAYAAMGMPKEARQAFVQARAAYRQLGHHLHVGDTVEYELIAVQLAYGTDDVGRRRQLLSEGIEAFAQAMPASFYDTLRVFDLSVRVLEGEWTSAREYVQDIRTGRSRARLLHLSALAVIAQAQGDIDLAWAVNSRGIPAGIGDDTGE